MKNRVPKYRRHPNGQAFCQYQGKRYYLGVYGTDRSRMLYRQFLARILAAADDQALPIHSGADLSIAEAILAHDAWAAKYYAKEGIPGKEYRSLQKALEVVDSLYGNRSIAEFKPSMLEAIQDELVRQRYARTHINHTVSRIKRFFRWCARKDLCRPELYSGLLCVPGLQKGRTSAAEPPSVGAVNWHWVEALLPFVPPTIAAMIQVQYFCGMRPQDVCRMRPCDIDMSHDIWLYRPSEHKTAWRGHVLVKAIPLRAQGIVKQFIARPTDAHLFSPREADEWRREQRRIHSKPDRKTPVYPSELRARERRRAETKRRHRSNVGEHYTTESYRRAILYGFQRARAAGVDIPHWHPNQLRHGIATEVDKTLGRQAAQRWLGHASMDTTGIYTEQHVAELIELARALDQRWAG